MSFDAFQRHARNAQARSRATSSASVVVPVVRRRSADLTTPVAAFLALRDGANFPFLLESVEGGEKLARYSFLGKDPYRILRATGARVEIEERREGVAPPPEHATEGNVFDVLRTLTSGYTTARVPGLPRLAGGAVGYLGYDAVRLLEDLPDAPDGGLDLPDAVWAFYDQIVAFDHARHQVALIKNVFLDAPDANLRTAYDDAERTLDALEADLHQPASPPAPVTLTGPPGDTPAPSNISRDAFEEAVRTAKDHIRAGDIFQVVLSQRLEMTFDGDRFNLYRALRQVNPSPYLFYLDFDDFALAGASPEVLVRVEHEPSSDEASDEEPPARAELLPIAGTRPRGAGDAEDRALAEELAADEKERAEHLMLVDLGRNDLSRVCRAGTVEVERYAFVERYSHVMHLVSEVAGQLKDEQDAIAALQATFPAGTVSGAPKVRAMQIIDALETERRGIYAGAVGHLSFDGALDTCIAIRTMVIEGDTAYVQAGAGIVADSIPSAEYEETLNKARALREAVRVAAEELF